MSGRFDHDTRVVVDDPAGLRAEVDPTWSGYLGAHGGYVAAIALRAMASAVDDEARRPRSLDVHLLEPVGAGRVELAARLERRGGTASTASLRAVQGGRSVAVATATFALEAPGVDHAVLTPPEVPGPQACAPLVEAPVAEAGMSQYVEHRPAADPLPLTGGDRAEIAVWMRLGEARPVDALSAAFLVDAAVPALYGRLSAYVAMPTVELTLHFAEAVDDGLSPWVLGVFRTLRAAEGFAVEDGELWSEDGRLLLTARQLRRVLVPATVDVVSTPVQ